MECGWNSRLHRGAGLTAGGNGCSLQGSSDTDLAPFATSPSTSTFQGVTLLAITFLEAPKLILHYHITWHLCIESFVSRRVAARTVLLPFCPTPLTEVKSFKKQGSLWPSHCTPRYISKRTKNISSHKNPHRNVRSNTIHSSHYS